jgi:hypothetical protein
MLQRSSSKAAPPRSAVYYRLSAESLPKRALRAERWFGYVNAYSGGTAAPTVASAFEAEDQLVRLESISELTAPSDLTEFAVATLLGSAYTLVSLGKAREAFRQICESIEEDFAGKSAKMAAELLRQIDPSAAGPYVSTGVLRLTYRVHASIAEWRPALLRTVQYLRDSGIDPAIELRGLLKTPI